MTGAQPRKSRKGGQPGRCSICTHPDRVSIEMLKCQGASMGAIAAQFPPISRFAIMRHFRSHVSDRKRAELLAGPARIHDLANAAAKESKSLLEYLRIMRSVLFNQFLASAEANDRLGVVNVSSQLLASLKELGKMTGELRQLSGITINQNVLNITADPGYPALETGLLEIVHRHPAVRDDVLALLARLEEASTAPGPNGSPFACIEGSAEEIEAPANVA